MISARHWGTEAATRMCTIKQQPCFPICSMYGDSLFIAAMSHYFNQWKICHPYFDDFRNSIIQFTHVDLNWFFDEWMETTKRVDYAVGKVKQVKLKGESATLSGEYKIQLFNSTAKAKCKCR